VNYAKSGGYDVEGECLSGVKNIKLSLWQKLQLRINGSGFLRWEKREGWNASLPIYAVKCKKHGLYEDYRHGHSETFQCSECLKDAKKIAEKP